MPPTDDGILTEIERTLRSLVYVPRLNSSSLVNRPAFWNRCRLVFSNVRQGETPRIFVDGFAQCCLWNTWKVYTDAIEKGLTVWLGYAFGNGSWTEHAWCMLGERIVETTSAFQFYYGASVTTDELKRFCDSQAAFNLFERDKISVVTMIDGYRKVVPYDAAVHRDTIGRERDEKTGKIKEGLGR